VFEGVKQCEGVFERVGNGFAWVWTVVSITFVYLRLVTFTYVYLPSASVAHPNRKVNHEWTRINPNRRAFTCPAAFWRGDFRRSRTS
jgi:hypothetical protein